MNKYKNLDGLRGLAALIVVFWHYSLGFLPALAGYTATKHFHGAGLISSTPLHLFIAGPSAVSLFFVLSGFVLSLKFFKTNDTASLTSSAIRRYFRLMLPALGSILITYFVLAIGMRFVRETGTTTGSDWLGVLWNVTPNFFGALWQGVYTLFFVQPFDANASYNFNLWTMHMELFGSFMVFMFLVLFGKLRKRWIVYVALGIVFLQNYYLGFLLGVAIADAWTSHKEMIERFTTPIMNVGVLLSGLFLLAYYIPPQMNGVYSHIILPGFSLGTMPALAQTIGGALVITAVLSSQKLTRFFESRPLQYLGNISFSLYLLHLVFLGTVACFIFNHLVWRVGYGPALIAAGGITLPLTFMGASLYTKYVDANAIVFSRVVSNYILSNKSTKSRVAEAPEESPRSTLNAPSLGVVD